MGKAGTDCVQMRSDMADTQEKQDIGEMGNPIDEESTGISSLMGFGSEDEFITLGLVL